MAEGLEDVLRPGEQVVWEGRTQRGLTFNVNDAGLMAAGTMGAIIGVGLALQGSWLLGVPILLVGAYFALGQLLIETRRRRRTRYVLTTDRAYLVHAWPRASTTVIDLRRCGPSTITHHRDGTGTISFGPFPRSLVWIGPLRWAHPAFRFIADADELLLILRGEATLVGGDEPPEVLDGGAGEGRAPEG